MSSIGVACAEVYVKQKRQMEKIKRMEEERVRRGESVVEEDKVGGSASTSGKCKKKVHPDKCLGKKKVHPGNFPASESEGKQGEARDNVA
ncbi:hypothetical protein POPTR_007G086400v4 [Populus trichocarpa]|uniref:Uncharacterized protein n=1 Tax=Populus trichocarpa TaxID=3694 RepID=A0ACC0SQD3_POPTR|nr:hypothetical protein POPTR_007G086400v4 [Populus trichocarpa]